MLYIYIPIYIDWSLSANKYDGKLYKQINTRRFFIYDLFGKVVAICLSRK